MSAEAATKPVLDEQDVSTNSAALERYRDAGSAADAAIKALFESVVPGTDTAYTLAKRGDALISAEVSKGYAKLKMTNGGKGIAYPTTIGINNCVGCLAPREESVKPVFIQKGDTLSVELGVQFDGYPVLVAKSAVVGATEGAKAEGRNADVVLAAYTAAEAAARLVRAGNRADDVVKAVKAVAAAYECNHVEGVQSHVVQRNELEVENTFFMRASKGTNDKAAGFKFEVGKCYAIDIQMSTGPGKVKERDERPTVFKRNLAIKTPVKSPAGRQTQADFKNYSHNMAYGSRNLDELERERAAAEGREAKTGLVTLGMTEMKKASLVHTYAVVYENKGEFTASCKFTMAVMPSGVIRLTGDSAVPHCVSEKKIEDEFVLSVLARSMKNKKKASKAKLARKAKRAAEAAAAKK